MVLQETKQSNRVIKQVDKHPHKNNSLLITKNVIT
jgi:hypothetical protein